MPVFYRYTVFIIIAVFVLIAPDRGFCGSGTEGRTIVIDPGHGGADAGTKGADNSVEKDIVLTAAVLLKSVLDETHTVSLTRTDDFWLGLKKRAETANTKKADLFISIHTGAGFTREAEGISFISFKPVQENAGHNGNRPSAEWGNVQEGHTFLSCALAEALEKRFSGLTTFGRVQSKKLSLPVLAGANMPALLIEIGHLTNPAEEKRLKNYDYLSDFMKEIAAEIDLFLRKHQNID